MEEHEFSMLCPKLHEALSGPKLKDYLPDSAKVFYNGFEIRGHEVDNLALAFEVERCVGMRQYGSINKQFGTEVVKRAIDYYVAVEDYETCARLKKTLPDASI